MARSTVLAALIVLTSAASVRADGIYFSEGVGGTRVHDELSSFMPDAMHVRIALGMRKHEWAYELFFAGHFNDSYDYGSNETNLVTGGLSVKYIQPVAPHLEVYLRGTASLGSTDEALQGFSGRGLGAGAGIQLKGKGSVLGLLWWPLFFLPQGPRMTAALWLDTGYEFYRLQPPAGQRANAPNSSEGGLRTANAPNSSEGGLRTANAPNSSEGGLRTANAIDAQLSTITLGIALGTDF